MKLSPHHPQQPPQPLRQRRFEAQPLPGDRVAHVGAMDADLVGAAGVEPEAPERKSIRQPPSRLRSRQPRSTSQGARAVTLAVALPSSLTARPLRWQRSPGAMALMKGGCSGHEAPGGLQAVFVVDRNRGTGRGWNRWRTREAAPSQIAKRLDGARGGGAGLRQGVAVGGLMP